MNLCLFGAGISGQTGLPKEVLDIQENLAMLVVYKICKTFHVVKNTADHNECEDETKQERTVTSGGQIRLLFG